MDAPLLHANMGIQYICTFYAISKLSAASCRESSILKKNETIPFMLAYPAQAAGRVACARRRIHSSGWAKQIDRSNILLIP